MSPCLASASSKSKYDVFFDLRDATCFERAFIENKLRDAGITSSLEDVEEVLYAYEAAERSGIVMVLFTWDFLASQMCLKRLVARLEQWNNNLVLLPVFRGVSPQVVEKMLPDLLPASDFARVSFLPGFKLSLDFRGGFLKKDGLICEDHWWWWKYPRGILFSTSSPFSLLGQGYQMKKKNGKGWRDFKARGLERVK